MRALILVLLGEQADADGTVLLGDLVAAAQDRYGARVPGSSPQRIRLPSSKGYGDDPPD